MHGVLARVRLLLALAPIAVAVLACGAVSTVAVTVTPSPTATPTNTPRPEVRVTLSQVATIKQVANSAQGPFSASASCPAGLVMVSGGYKITRSTGGPSAEQTDVLVSYPSSTSTWSVTGLNASVGGALTLSVFADCLQDSLPATSTIVSAGPASGTVTAACPDGSSVSGGGYQGSGHFSSFAPAAEGWAATLVGSGTTTVYAVCLTSDLTTGSSPSASAPVVGNSNGEASAACPAGQFLVGGAYTLTPPAVAYTSAGDTLMTTWQVQASDRSFGSASNLSVTAEAVCLTPQV